MKRLTIFTSLLMLCFSMLAKIKDLQATHPGIHVISNQSDAFYFKVDKTIIGGKVEVFDSTGHTVLTQVIASKHTLVDLHYQNPGIYSIVIHKGDFSQKFDYDKKTPSPYMPVSFFNKSKTKPWRYC